MDIKHWYIEKRSYKRIKTNFVFSYQIAKPVSLRVMIGWDKEVNALMLDLSEGGLALLTKYNIPPWAVLFMKFTLIGSGGYGEEQAGEIEAIGEVRYNLLVKNKKSEHRLGVSFMYVSDEDKDKIANFLNRLDRRSSSVDGGESKYRKIYWGDGIFSKELPKVNGDKT